MPKRVFGPQCRLRSELEEQAYTEMVQSEQEKLTEESERRVKDLEDKLKATEESMRADIAAITDKIATYEVGGSLLHRKFQSRS